MCVRVYLCVCVCVCVISVCVYMCLCARDCVNSCDLLLCASVCAFKSVCYIIDKYTTPILTSKHSFDCGCGIFPGCFLQFVFILMSCWTPSFSVIFKTDNNKQGNSRIMLKEFLFIPNTMAI